MDLGALLQGFQRSAWRLETLDVYDTPEERPAVEHFERTGLVQPRQDGWIEMLDAIRGTGRTIGRVHAVSVPLSDYLRFEVGAYREHTEHGEVVRLGERAAIARELGSLFQDFWIVDGETVAVLQYDGDGRFLGVDDASDRLDDYLRAQHAAIRLSTPLDQWTDRALAS